MADYELGSRYLSMIIDNLGYSGKMREFRRAAYQEQDKLLTIKDPTTTTTTITSGSKGEGITKPHESDMDCLYIYNSVVCVEEDMSPNSIADDVTVFIPDARYCYPGYVILILARLVPPVSIHVYNALSPSPDGQYYLSSDKFSKSVVQNQQSCSVDRDYSRAGPAATVCVSKRHYDLVHSLPYTCPSVLYEWVIRPRPYDWPPLAIRLKALQIGANLVATGFKDSQMKDYEWRICFNQIELVLIHSLNDTQTKLYILLKLVLKQVLKPKGKEITSYVMKNIVFWLTEQNPQNAFTVNDLVCWLMKALRLLKRSIQTQYLPYFMIPGRNLLIEKMTPVLRKRLIERLTVVLHEGPCFLLRCKKLTMTIPMTNNGLTMFSARRDELEILSLTEINYRMFLWSLGRSDEEIENDDIYVTLIRRMIALIRSDWPPYLQRQLNECSGLNDMRAQILK